MKIVKIFPTIEGESSWSGTAVTFVRFGLCNLSCVWCDTDFSKFTEMSLVDVLQKVESFPSKRVAISGGEPTIHLMDIYALSSALRAAGYLVSLQTNGTNEIDIEMFDHVVLSPKEDVEMAKQSQQGNRTVKQFVCHDLKLVDKRWSIEQYQLYASRFTILKDRWIQPLSNEKDSIDRCVQLVMNNPQWRLSLQTHKMVGVE